MDPAFSTTRIRAFLPVFQRSAKKVKPSWLLTAALVLTVDSVSQLCRLWRQELAGGPAIPSLNVSPWFSRMTLDAICEGQLPASHTNDRDRHVDERSTAGFDFNCGALDNDMNEFVRVYKGMLYESTCDRRSKRV